MEDHERHRAASGSGHDAPCAGHEHGQGHRGRSDATHERGHPTHEPPGPVESLQKGDRVVVKPGEKFPTDGVVAEGRSTANEALLTGEARPAPKGAGDSIIGGALNGDGSITMQVEKVGEETFLAQVVSMVRSAETQTLAAAGLFIAIGLRPNAGLVSEMTPLNDRGEIIIERDCSTAVAGLFAAGDVTDAYGKRIVIASGEGAKAAMAARQHILALRRNRAPTG